MHLPWHTYARPKKKGRKISGQPPKPATVSTKPYHQSKQRGPPSSNNIGKRTSSPKATGSTGVHKAVQKAQEKVQKEAKAADDAMEVGAPGNIIKTIKL